MLRPPPPKFKELREFLLLEGRGTKPCALENFRRGGEAETVTTCERTLWPLEKPQRKEGGAGSESDDEEDAAAKRHQNNESVRVGVNCRINNGTKYR